VKIYWEEMLDQRPSSMQNFTAGKIYANPILVANIWIRKVKGSTALKKRQIRSVRTSNVTEPSIHPKVKG
jgi:hypothetical protein